MDDGDCAGWDWDHLTDFTAAGRATSLVDAVRESFMFRNLPVFVGADARIEPPSEEIVSLYRGAVAPKSLETFLAQNS